MNNIVKLDLWCIIPSGDAYTAPELRTQHLNGIVTNHPRHEDGKNVTTSPITGLDEDGLITTKSGTKYQLGNPHPSYEQTFPNAKERLFNNLKKNN